MRRHDVIIIPIAFLSYYGCLGFTCIRCPPAVHSHSQHRLQHPMTKVDPPTPSSGVAVEQSSSTIEANMNEQMLSKRIRIKNMAKRLWYRLPFTRQNYSNTQQQSQQPAQEQEEELPIMMESTPLLVNNITSQPETISIQDKIPSDNETDSASKTEGKDVSNDKLSSRQRKAAESVDLSGTWKPILTDAFKKEYDEYLANCSQSFMFRKIVANGIGYQKEIIRQLDGGVNLEIIATNPAGNWNRTLVTSEDTNPLNVTITDPDGDKVHVEAYWKDGIKHTSLLRGKPRVEGGVFETVRYLESEDVLVCDSVFIPPESSTKFKYGQVQWRFRRV